MKAKQLLFSLVVLSLNYFSLSAQNKFPTTVGSNVEIDGGSIKLFKPATSGSWARGLFFYNTKTDNEWAGIGLYGTAETVNSIYIGHGNDPWWGNKGIHILANGNTGVGTTVPNAKFEVVGQDVNFYSNNTTNTFNIGRNANETFKLYVTDNSAYFDYLQDSDDNSIHSFSIRNLAGGTSANNDIRFFAGDYNRMVIRPDGYIGIGTTGPKYKLHIITGTNGDRAIGFSNAGNYISDNTSLLYTASGSGSGIFQDAGNLMVQPRTNAPRGIYLNTFDGTSIDTRLAVNSVGNVGIGTTSPYYKLDVEGTIRAHEIKVNLYEGADFVFEEDYNLMPLDELETFVKTQKHLPEVAPAKEMETEGLTISEMNIKLLQKIEELTLYTIEQQKLIETLMEKVNKLESNK